MATYKVKSTRKEKAAISIGEGEIDNSIAMKLFGRKKLSYGKDLNENLLRLLETFACPQELSAKVPDKTKATDNMFDNPVEGQLWYNSTPTKEALFVFDGSNWVEQHKFGSIAANWGVIADGGQIPLPVAPNGRTFTYAECSWIVSPYGYPNSIDYMNCRTSADATVMMQYSLENDSSMISGFANYLIIGIPGNVNLGSMSSALPPTPTPTTTATPTQTKTPTPTPTVTISNTPTPTPSRAAVSPSPTSTPAPTPDPGVSVTPTRAPTPTPSPLPPFSLTLTQGDGSAYGDGMLLEAYNSGLCRGWCGSGSGFAPGMLDDSQYLGITINGGVAPFTLVVDTWAVDPGSPNTMFGEFLSPMGNFSGAQVAGNPLNNPTWTWTGGSTAGRIALSAKGKCAYNDRNVTGSAVIHCTDDTGRTVSVPFGWTMIRQASGGDMGCDVDGCVTCDTEILGSGIASTVKVGDTMTVIDPVTLELGTGLVSKADIKTQPCVRITTESGVILECSTTAPIALASGEQALAPTLAGLDVLVYDNGLVSTEKVVSVEDIGDKEIVHITCENNFFLAGAEAGRYLLHHNAKTVP